MSLTNTDFRRFAPRTNLRLLFRLLISFLGVFATLRETFCSLFSSCQKGNARATLAAMSNVNLYVAIAAWREILARVFDGFTRQENVSPPWLTNPATRRRLKLDIFYPEAGMAFRFVGLTAKGQKRQSDLEVAEEEERDQVRQDLCRQHDVQLFLIEPLDDPLKQMDNLGRLLSRAGRSLAQSDHPTAYKIIWQPRIAEARERAEETRRLMTRQPEQMLVTLADSWRDREAGLFDAPPPPPAADERAIRRALATLDVGQRIAHSKHGEGVITALNGTGDDATVTILFDGDQSRTFLVAYALDKLSAA